MKGLQQAQQIPERRARNIPIIVTEAPTGRQPARLNQMV